MAHIEIFVDNYLQFRLLQIRSPDLFLNTVQAGGVKRVKIPKNIGVEGRTPQLRRVGLPASGSGSSLPVMIADTLDQRRRYTGLSPRFAAAFEFLEKLPANQPAGRYDIDGNNCYALMQAYATRPVDQAKVETHRQYIDIQFIQSGLETMLWAPLLALEQVTQPYVPENDVIFYATPPQMTPLKLGAGQFVIFFPADGHAGGLECGTLTEVRKVVIKVRV